MTTLLLVAGVGVKRGADRGEALCMEQQVFCVSFTNLHNKRNFVFEVSIPHKIRHTHTQPLRLLYTNDQLVTQTATYKTHNKHNRRISMPSVGFEPAIAQIKELQPTPWIV